MYLSGSKKFSTKLVVFGIVIGLFGLASSESWSPPDDTLLQHHFLSKFRLKGGDADNRAASENSLIKLWKEAKKGSLFSRFLKAIIFRQLSDHEEGLNGANNDEDLKRMNRNYYGWMDFGKRATSEDFEY